MAWPLPLPLPADVEHVDPGRQPVGEAIDEWHHLGEQAGVVGGCALLGHDPVEVAVLRVGHTPAIAEAIDKRLLDRRHERDELGFQRFNARLRRAALPRIWATEPFDPSPGNTSHPDGTSMTKP